MRDIEKSVVDMACSIQSSVLSWEDFERGRAAYAAASRPFKFVDGRKKARISKKALETLRAMSAQYACPRDFRESDAPDEIAGKKRIRGKRGKKLTDEMAETSKIIARADAKTNKALAERYRKQRRKS